MYLITASLGYIKDFERADVSVLDTTYAGGSVVCFMQGLLHGKTKIEMKLYLKKRLNCHWFTGIHHFINSGNNYTYSISYT